MSLSSLLALLLLAAPPPATAPKTQRVLVMPLKPVGVAPALATRATEVVAQAVSVRPGYSAVTQADVQKMVSLQATRTSVGCDDKACMAELSRLLQADLLVTGSVGAVGRKTTVNLFLVDPQSAATRATASADVDGTRELVTKLPELTAQLMGWKAQEQARYQLPAGKQTSFAVLDLTASGVGELVAVNLTRVLASELKRVQGTTVISREDVRALLQLQEDKARMGCDDMECLAEIGGALGVENIVTGSVGRLADSYMVSLRLINARQSRVESAVTEAFSGTEEQLIKATRRAGRRLLGMESADKGQLAVGASEPGAEVRLNGVSRGKVPMPPLPDIVPGVYSLQVSRDGYQDWASDVYVEPGETTAVWAQLTARPTPWFKKWWVWTLLGGAGTGAALTLVLASGGVVALALGGYRYVTQSNSTAATVTVQ